MSDSDLNFLQNSNLPFNNYLYRKNEYINGFLSAGDSTQQDIFYLK